MINVYVVKEVGGKLEKFEYDFGEFGVYDVEIDVESCGICYSDLSMLDNEWGIIEFFFVLGYEVVGIVSKIGDYVILLKVG